MEPNVLRDFARLLHDKQVAKTTLDEIQREVAERRPAVLEAMADAGITRTTFDALGTLYLHQQGWARVRDKEALTSAMTSAGLGDMVEERVNSNRLSALYREWAETGEPAPPELDGVVDYEVVDDVRLRAA